MKNKHGQSLIEIVVAIGILGVMLVGVVAGATIGLKGARVSQERAYAKSLADTVIEQARASKTTNPSAFFAAGNHTDVSTNSTAPVYTVTTTYTISVSNPNLMTVSVVVSWPDGNSTYTVRQDTYFSKQ